MGRTEALIEARTNKPSGRRYNEAIGAWLRSTGFIDIHKSIRSRTVEMMDHRQDVEEFLATLKLEKRIKLNNPTVILSAWKRSLTKQEAKEKIKLELSAAWNKAKAEERRQFLGGVQLTELLAVMPQTMVEEIKTRVLGQYGAAAPPASVNKTLTLSLQHSLSILSTNKDSDRIKEALAGLAAITRKLASQRLTLHDIAVTIVKKGARAA